MTEYYVDVVDDCNEAETILNGKPLQGWELVKIEPINGGIFICMRKEK